MATEFDHRCDGIISWGRVAFCCENGSAASLKLKRVKFLNVLMDFTQIMMSYPSWLLEEGRFGCQRKIRSPIVVSAL